MGTVETGTQVLVPRPRPILYLLKFHSGKKKPHVWTRVQVEETEVTLRKVLFQEREKGWAAMQSIAWAFAGHRGISVTVELIQATSLHPAHKHPSFPALRKTEQLGKVRRKQRHPREGSTAAYLLTMFYS